MELERLGERSILSLPSWIEPLDGSQQPWVIGAGVEWSKSEEMRNVYLVASVPCGELARGVVTHSIFGSIPQSAYSPSFSVTWDGL